MRRRGNLGAGLAAAAGLCLARAGSCMAGYDELFRDEFASDRVDPKWSIDVSEGNAVEFRDGYIEIRAAENTHAHLQRPLQTDLVRAECVLEPDSGISWCTSLFLFWGPTDWCQIGVIPRGGGRYYACMTTAGIRDEYDLSRCLFDAWHHVAIELGEDCIRFQTSSDGTTWRTELFVERSATLRRAPALLVAGKGFAISEADGDLDADYGDRGPVAISRIRRVSVRPTDAARYHVTPEERRAKALADRDPAGTEILAMADEPGYAAVAARMPALARPREAVGVPHHRYEIGIDDDGTIQLGDDTDLWEQTGSTAAFEFGAPPVRLAELRCRKRLLGGYLPIVVSEGAREQVRYEQTVFGWSDGMSPDAPLWAYARLRIRNESERQYAGPVVLRLTSEDRGGADLGTHVVVEPSGSADVCARIPVPYESPASLTDVREFDERLDEAGRAWTETFGTSMRIETPEARVNDAYKAWLAYNAINVDKVNGGYEPHDGAGFYEEIFGYSAALYCHALDLWGRHAESEAILESLLQRVGPDGLFYVRYGLPDHGSMLLALCEHYRLSGREGWMRDNAQSVLRMCDWIIGLRGSSLESSEAQPAAVRGLIRFAPYADFGDATYNFYGNAYCCIGLENAADVLAELEFAEESERLAAEAAAYRADILRAMDAAVIRKDGVRLLPIEPGTQRLLASMKYKGGGYYGLVASMLLESEFLAPDDERARMLVEALENRAGLIMGMCEFDGGVDHAYTYGYWLNCLRRGDIRRVLLGFYATLAYGMGRDTYCGVEVTQITTGEPTPTMPHLYSGTQQLRLLRQMLVCEDGDDLLLCGAAPRRWFEHDSALNVMEAPTRFGTVCVRIRSAAGEGRVSAAIDLPERSMPQRIRIRLPHPEGRPIATAAARNATVLSAAGDEIILKPGGGGGIRIEAEYAETPERGPAAGKADAPDTRGLGG